METYLVGSYTFININNDAYDKYACQYQNYKRTGVRAVYRWATGVEVEVFDIVKKISLGSVRTRGRRKIGRVAYIGYPLATLVTNSTATINITKKGHSAVSFALECSVLMTLEGLYIYL